MLEREDLEHLVRQKLKQFLEGADELPDMLSSIVNSAAAMAILEISLHCSPDMSPAIFDFAKNLGEQAAQEVLEGAQSAQEDSRFVQPWGDA